MLKKYFIVVLLFFCANLFAQEPIRYTTKQGLPSNHIYDIAEDQDGFIWFATKQGLVKYDGESFKTITIKDGLPNNDTYLIEPDLHGRLWYFSKSVYQGYIKNDSIYKLAAKKQEVNTPRFIYKTADSLWIQGTSGLQKYTDSHIVDIGLFKSGNTQFFENNLNKIKEEHGLSLKKLTPVIINPQTKELCIVVDDTLLIYDWDFKLKNEIPIPIPLDDGNSYPHSMTMGLIYNQIGFHVSNTGVLFFNFKDNTAIYKSFKDLIGVKETEYFRCRSLENEFQISVLGHLMVFNYNLELQHTYAFPKELSKSSYKDSKGNIWLTDLANGVSLIPNTQAQTQYYLENQKVQKINKIEHNFYAGINDKGFYKLDSKENKFKALSHFNASNAEIYQIKEDDTSHEKYFMSGIITYSLKGLKLQEYNLKALNGLNYDQLIGCKDITNYEGSNYIVTGDCLFKSKNPQEAAQLIVRKSGLLFSVVHNNNLYIAGSDGLHQVIKDTLVKPKIKHELLDVSISSIASGKEFLIVGTDGRGVYVLKDHKVIHLKNTDDYSVQKIIEKENQLWLATNKGVHNITLDGKDLENSKISNSYYDADGLLQNNVNDIYIEKDTLYAATDTGLSKLVLNSKLYSQSPQLYFKTQNDTLNYKNEKRDNIAISFALQNFVNQNYVNYQYRLIPNQKQWTSTQSKTINFSNLSPGLYTLEVQAIDQHLNSSTKKITLNIIPKWWQTLAAKIGFGFLLACLLGVALKLLKLQIQKKAHEKADQDKRVSGLELQALRSQMNPHFVHNSLNAIQYFIQRNEVELSEEYLSSFSHLIRLFFEYSRRQTITIDEEVMLLTNYLEIEKLRFEEKLNFNITICDHIDVHEQHIPSMLLQPIVENAVNHGLFHKEDIGNLQIVFKAINSTTYTVTIIDDGIGINKAKEIYHTSTKNYESNSSQVLKERLFLLNKSNLWDVDYHIIDRSTQAGIDTGTIVTLKFTQLIAT